MLPPLLPDRRQRHEGWLYPRQSRLRLAGAKTAPYGETATRWAIGKWLGVY